MASKTDTNVPGTKHDSIAVQLLAGSAGGASQVLVGQPLDTIKTRAQTALPGQFKGPLDIFRQTLAKEGVLGFYKGMASPLIGVASVNSLLFTAFLVGKRLVDYGNDAQLSIPQVAVAGGFAGGVQAILASPVEMFKIRMQGQYGGAGDKKLSQVVSGMWKDYGFRQGIMRGYWITFIREIPAYAAFYGCYEASKRAFARSHPDTPLSILELTVAGSAGGVGYWMISYPLDVIKSSVQLSNSPPVKGGLRYIPLEARKIMAEGGGSKALFRGLTPTLLRAVPAAGATFVAFEVAKEFFEKHL